MKLAEYGWNSRIELFYKSHIKKEFEIGRVISIKGLTYTIVSKDGELSAELSGKLLYDTETEDLPKTGDWVNFVRYEPLGYIVEVLPRLNELARKNPGNKTERQVMAANIDCAIIVQGLDQNYNMMRLERYLVQVLACNIQPVILFNKADLIDNPEFYRNEVSKLGRDCPVLFCSTFNGTGIAELEDTILKQYQTFILIGSSGAGKSSLLNALLGNSRRATGDISDSTGKGRHITTSRDLFQLPNGSLLIDTPGMREFGFAIEELQESAGLFPLIGKLAEKCRYSDCRHIEEAGCAVLEAYAAGKLDPIVYDSYLKLWKEQKHFEIRIEDKKRMGKQFGKMVREVREHRKKYKY